MAERREKLKAKVTGPAGRMLGGEKAKDFKGTMRQLLHRLKPFRIRLAVVFTFAIVSTIFSIVSPAILGRATDIIVKGLFRENAIDYTALVKIIAFLVGLYGISYIFAAAQGFIMAGVSQRVTYVLRKDLSEKIDTLPLKYFDTTTHGELQSRIVNDIETINQTLSQSITQTITSFVTIAGMIAMMLRISVLMTLVALLVLPASMFVIRIAVGKSQAHFNDQQKYLGQVNGHVEEMYTGHTIVKLFNKEEESAERFDDINESLAESAWKSQFLSGLMMPITQLIGNLGFVAVCILGGFLAVRGNVSIGNIQAFIQYVRNFNQPVQQVANVANLLQSTAAAAERVFEVINEEDEEDPTAEEKGSNAEGPMADGEDGVQGVITFDHVSFGYKDDEIIIKDFSFEAKEGQRIAIVGPTGAGKTTLVKLLLRYYELNGGAISIDGKDIKDFERGELRSLFGMVLQDTWLYSGSIRDNIKYGREDASDEEVEEAAKAAHIDHYIRLQPEGYDTTINEDASNISQGQKQLLTIARAMLADNPILILDEATSSVDTRTERLIQEAMAKLMKGRTSFVIAHRLSTIKDADNILVLDKGDIVEQGTHEELLAANGFYANLYNSQFVGKA